jgi:hypothetical protein
MGVAHVRPKVPKLVGLHVRIPSRSTLADRITIELGVGHGLQFSP